MLPDSQGPLPGTCVIETFLRALNRSSIAAHFLDHYKNFTDTANAPVSQSRLNIVSILRPPPGEAALSLRDPSLEQERVEKPEENLRHDEKRVAEKDTTIDNF